MAKRFEKTDLKIVVVAPASTLRGLISSVLKELGFSNITTVADIKTCIEILETEPIGWIIAPNADNSGGHVLNILQILEKNPALRAMKLSILRDDDDSCIAAAFELGALSQHKFEPSRELCLAEFQSLMQKLERFDSDFTRVAASYLADFLLEKEEYQELKRFYASLLQIYPNKPDILLELAKVHFEAREMEEARLILGQLLLTAPEKKAQIMDLCRIYLPGQALDVKITSGIAHNFGFKVCLLLDNDELNLVFMEELMKKIGFQHVFGFSDPIELMRWLRQNPKPDLVISEWKLPNIPGPIFLYKVRRRLEAQVPIIVINRQISGRDQTWIRELDVSCLVAKPIVEKELFQAVVWTMQQSKGPSDLQSLKVKLKLASRTQDKELADIRLQYMQHAMLLESDRLIMEAQLAYDAGFFLHSKKFALDAVREAADPREALELLSKSLMKLREFDAAIRCLENVTVLSPYNVNYLCEMAECHLEAGDDSKFATYLDQAKGLDPEADIVLETEAKGAMKQGHTEAAKKLLQNLKSFKEVLAFMNNRAVALIQTGKHIEGLDLYRKALASLPEGHPEARALLYYNLGLGYARSGRLEDAAKALHLATQTKNAQRLKKSLSLKNRVTKALAEGSLLNFPSEKELTIEEEKERMETLKAIAAATDDPSLKIHRSDYCVYRIFRSLLDDTKAREIIASSPAFTPRGKLVKDYIHGISQVSSNFPQS